MDATGQHRLCHLQQGQQLQPFQALVVFPTAGEVALAGGGTKLAVLGRPGAGALAEAGSALGVGVRRGLALDGSLDEAGGKEGAGALALETTDSEGGSSLTLDLTKLVGSLSGWRSAPQLRQSCFRGLWCGKWHSAKSQAMGTSLRPTSMTAGRPPSLIIFGTTPAGPEEKTLLAAER